MNRRNFLRSAGALSALSVAEFAPWQAKRLSAGVTRTILQTFQLGHRESRDPAGSSGFQVRNVSRAPGGKCLGKLARKAGAFHRKSGTVRHRHMGKGENLLPAMPTGESGKGIGTDQQHQRLCRPVFGTQAGQGVHCIARRHAQHFAGIDLKTGISGRRPLHHLETLQGSHLRLSAMPCSFSSPSNLKPAWNC